MQAGRAIAARTTARPLTIIRTKAIDAMIAAFLLSQNFTLKKGGHFFSAAAACMLAALSIALALGLIA